MEATAAAPDLLVVLSADDNDIALVDPATLRVVKRLPTGDRPRSIGVTRNGIAFVANYGTVDAPGHTLTMIDLRRRSVLRTIELGTFTRPHGIAMSRDDRSLWVTCEGASAVIEIDVATGSLMRDWRTEHGTSPVLVTDADERKLYATNPDSGGCGVIDRESGGVRFVRSGRGTGSVDRAAGREELWIANRESNDLVVLDARSDTVLARIPSAGQEPLSVRCTPDGREAWVAHAGSRNVSVYNTSTRALIVNIPLATKAAGLFIEPSGKRALVASRESDQITVIDVPTRAVVKVTSIGRAPGAMAWVPATK